MHQYQLLRRKQLIQLFYSLTGISIIAFLLALFIASYGINLLFLIMIMLQIVITMFFWLITILLCKRFCLTIKSSCIKVQDLPGQLRQLNQKFLSAQKNTAFFAISLTTIIFFYAGTTCNMYGSGFYFLICIPITLISFTLTCFSWIQYIHVTSKIKHLIASGHYK